MYLWSSTCFISTPIRKLFHWTQTGLCDSFLSSSIAIVFLTFPLSFSMSPPQSFSVPFFLSPSPPHFPHSSHSHTQLTGSFKQPLVSSHSSSAVTFLEVQDGPEAQGSICRYDLELCDYLLQNLPGIEREGILGQTDLLISMAKFDLERDLGRGKRKIVNVILSSSTDFCQEWKTNKMTQKTLKLKESSI